MDRGVWWATVQRVTNSQTQLRDYTFTFTLQGWALKESLMSDLVFATSFLYYEY